LQEQKISASKLRSTKNDGASARSRRGGAGILCVYQAVATTTFVLAPPFLAYVFLCQPAWPVLLCTKALLLQRIYDSILFYVKKYLERSVYG
ncbi:MAG: hypothetical protein U0N60_08410, partial [Oscillospiraceae bacterium]